MISLIARLDEVESSLTLTKRTAVTRADKFRVELLSHEAAADHVDAWRDLAADPLEPNGFFEPGFALAAARYLEGGRPQFLFVWAGAKLVGLCPLQLPGRSLPWSQLRVFTHPQIALGAPLLDRARAAEALAAILTYCRERLPHHGGLMIPLLPQAGPTARLLSAAAKAEGREIRRFAAYERPILSAGVDPAAHSQRALNAGRRQKLNKALRRLGALGAVGFQLLAESEDLDVAAEEFLALEAKGWKGRRGTALLNSPERAAFARAGIAALAAEAKLRIGRLTCGGIPVAMALVLKSGGQAFYWKMAHDEDYALYSPGVLMSIELTRALLSDAGIAMTDSCAGPDQMIGHLWKGRVTVADFFVAIDTDHRRFLVSVAVESARRALRDRLKSIVQMLRRIKAATQKRPPRTP
ncbi:MAG: GNAT family N-acetyltransferase [Methylovirgula sp.]